MSNLSVREIKKEDFEPLIQYWISLTPDQMIAMGVDAAKMPVKTDWEKMLIEQIEQEYPEKKSYCLIWLLDNIPVGHSNINKIIFGEEAFMHLHMWQAETRKKGMGINFVKLCLPYYFENFKLKKIFCEPYALNPAPNIILPKLDFKFVKEYFGIPGWICFEQRVKLWELDAAEYKIQLNLKGHS